VGVDYRVDHGSHKFLQGGAGMLQQRGFEHPVDFLNMAPVKCRKNSTFIVKYGKSNLHGVS
jgi:hypothetical protein